MASAPGSARRAIPALEVPASRAGLLSLIWSLAWPVILTFLFESLVGIVDTLMVGQLGTDAVAGVGIGSQIFNAVSVTMSSVATGTVALVARHMGAGEHDAAERILQQSLYAVATLAVLLATPVFLGAHAIVEAFRVSPSVVEQGAGFTRYMMLALPGSATVFVLASGLRATGDTRTPLAIGLLVNVTNVCCAYTFIFGKFGMPALGVRGAGLASAIAFWVGALFGIAMLASGRLGVALRRMHRPLHVESIRRVLRIGIPTGLEQFLMQVGFLLYVGVVAGYGAAPVAAYFIGVRIMALSFLPGFGFGAAASTLVGQSLGSGRPHDATRSGWETNRLAILFMSAAGVLLYLFAEPIARAFISDREVVAHAVSFIHTLAIAQPLMAMDFTIGGALRGAGDTRFPLLSVLLGFYGARLCWATVAAFVLHLDVVWIWYALVGDYIVRVLLKGWRFRSLRWQRVRV